MELVPQLNDFSYDGIGSLIERCAGFSPESKALVSLGACAVYTQLAFRMGYISHAEEQELLLCIQLYSKV